MTTIRLSMLRALAVVLVATLAGACGGGGGGGGNPPPPPVTLNITIAALANGSVGTPYNQTITITGGTGAKNFTITVGTLPAGLNLNAATGALSGTPAATGMSNFTVQVTDSGTPQQNDTQALSITINAAPAGRNDSIATATALGNGDFAASISPSGQPSTVFSPDQDFYRIVTTGAATVTVDLNAQVNGSPIDTVLEILAANGARLNSCVAPAFTTPCVHDDETLGVNLDSFLQVRVLAATTFYVHVMDFRGDARPDLSYNIVISGVN